MEEWKVFQDYEISNFGNVKNSKRLLKCSINNAGEGYRYFQQHKDGKRINHFIHQLVAKLFIGEKPEGLVVDHIDRNSLNNNVSNLRYITQAENTRNSKRYRSDITETDRRLRQNILQKERETKIRRDKGVEERRPKGTGQLYRRLHTGNWRAVISINKIRYDKTFTNKDDAEKFLTLISSASPEDFPGIISTTSFYG